MSKDNAKQTVPKDANSVMKPSHILIVTFASIVLGWAAGAGSAAEDSARFLHALQDGGYGDMAVEYLKILKDRSDLPPEIREVWDLEMSRSLKLAAGAAYDAKQREVLLEQSQKHLARFLQEKPEHPDATLAIASWGDFLMRRALESLRRAKSLADQDKPRYETILGEARAGLLEAQGKFQEAEKKFQTRLDALPPPPPPTAKKSDRQQAAEANERVEANLQEARFQLALIDYYLAQTHADPKSADHVAALKKTAQSFDDVFQRNRGKVIGLYAHMWHGKILEELGDLRTALDIYDEVLANAPEPTEKGPATGLEPMFTQVEQFRLLILAKKMPRLYLPEATAYLKNFHWLKQTDGYQGIVLDVAKALLAEAEEATGPKKTKLMSEVLRLVTDGSKVRSQYQQELYSMRRDILQQIGRNLEINTFDDAIIAGDAAVESSQWQKALDIYNKAVEIAEKTKLDNPEDIAKVHEAIDRVRFLMAYDLYQQGKSAECLDMAGRIVRDSEGHVKIGSRAAAQASALGVAAALNLYATATKEEKHAALEKMMKVAEFTEKHWAGKPEADDARMARAQAKLVVGQVPKAIDIFEQVNPKSDRYATAMYGAGLNYWRLYLTEKLKRKGAPDKEQMATNRAKAVDRLQTAIHILNRRYVPGGPMPPSMLEAQLLLAEIYYEGDDPQRAAALYQPLVDAIRAEKPSPKTSGENTIRVFLGAVRAYGATGALDKAGAVGDVLIEIGPDTLQVNNTLVNFTKLLNEERKKADAQAIELENSANADAVDAALVRQASIRELLAEMLLKLAQRQELGLGHRIFIGGALNALDKTVPAREQFQKILKQMETDPEFAKRAQKAMSLIRTELLKVLRKQKNYDEALKQVDQLIEENPNALEPLMEKGRILEASAETNPDKFGEAVAHWTMLRNRLQRMRRKPNEYYEVMYNVAKCLIRQSEQSKDKTTAVDRARMAEQVLKSPMILTPKLNGPDTVAKYKALVDKAIVLQGRSPDSMDEKKQ